MKKTTLRLALISTIACSLCVPQQAYAVNKINQEKKGAETQATIVLDVRIPILFLITMYILYGKQINTGILNTRLLYATTENDIQKTQRYLSHGAHINSTNSDGDSPLIIALKNHNMGMVHCLLKQNDVDVFLENNRKKTPLVIAIEQKLVEAAKILIKRGAYTDPGLLQRAQQKNLREIIDLMQNLDEFPTNNQKAMTIYLESIQNNDCFAIPALRILYEHKNFYNEKTTLFKKYGKIETIKKNIKECLFLYSKEKREKLRKCGVSLMPHEDNTQSILWENHNNNKFADLIIE